VRLRARNIIHEAIERTVDSGFPLAISRWFKHRGGNFTAETLDSREFREHVCSVLFCEVSEAIEQIIDLDCEDGQLATLEPEQRYRIEVYQGGGGARWMVRGPDGGVLLTSRYSPIGEALDEAAEFARGRRLTIVSSSEPQPNPTP